jgi:hypothetical protein
MRTFKNKWFTRFADKEGLSDTDLKNVIRELEAGQIDADLGSGVLNSALPDREPEKEAVIGLSCFSGVESVDFSFMVLLNPDRLIFRMEN